MFNIANAFLRSYYLFLSWYLPVSYSLCASHGGTSYPARLQP